MLILRLDLFKKKGIKIMLIIEILFNLLFALISIIENIHDFFCKKLKINFHTIINLFKFILQISYVILLIIINQERLSIILTNLI